MTSPTTVRVDAALRHPLFLGALAVLLVNDHVLKGAELLPGFATGKLSDFAGMIVAPVVLAALTRARTRRGVALCLAAVGLGFSAINLSPVVAGWAESVMAFASWRIWVDPTDLIALPTLALAYQAMVIEPEPELSDPRAPRSLTYAALALGAFACMATSEDTGAECYSDGECQTGSSRELVCCAESCRDMAYDEFNCGRCGNICGGSQLCHLGECIEARQQSADLHGALDLGDRSELTSSVERLDVQGLELDAPRLSAGAQERGGLTHDDVPRAQTASELRDGLVVLTNGGRSVEPVHVRRVLDAGALDCARLAADPAAAAAGASFDDGVHTELESFETLALDARGACDAVLISHPVAGDALIAWSAETPFSLVRLVASQDWLETEGGGVLHHGAR